MRRHERGVERRAVELDRAHRGDAAARRRDLEAGDPVRRAVREAQPARDARDELVLVEPQHAHARRGSPWPDVHRRRVTGGSTSWSAEPESCGPGEREAPGCELARRVERRLDARHAARPLGSGARRTRRGRARLPPGASSRPARPRRRARRREACRVVARDVHGADADLGEPPHARRRGRARARARASRPGAHRDAPAVRALGPRRRASLASRPATARLGLDVVRVALEQHPGGRPSQSDGRRAVDSGRAPRPGRRPSRTTTAAGGRGRHRRVTRVRTPMRAERADQQPGQVVAADVLDGRAAAFHQRARRRSRSGPRARGRAAARRGAGVAPRARRRARRRRSRSDPAGRAGTPARPRPASAARSADRRPGADASTVRSAGSYATIPAGAVTTVGVRGAGPADLPMGARHRAGRPRRRPTVRHGARRRARRRRSEPRAIRSTAPSGDRRPSSPQRLPRGQHLVGVGAAGTGRTRRGAGPARRGRRARRSAASRRASRARCRARPRARRPRRRTPAGSRRPRRAPAPRSPGSRASNTISGCRLPSPAWKTFIIVSCCSSAIVVDAAAARRRAGCAGTTASWR